MLDLLQWRRKHQFYRENIDKQFITLVFDSITDLETQGLQFQVESILYQSQAQKKSL